MSLIKIANKNIFVRIIADKSNAKPTIWFSTYKKTYEGDRVTNLTFQCGF